jgi:hypothetical protein
MPRDRFDDPDTPGLYVQVNTRRPDGDPQAPDTEGHCQISTHDEQGATTAAGLLGWALGIISNVDAPESGWPSQPPEWREAARAWLDKVASHAPELTGTYITLTPDTARKLIKSLHRGINLAWPDPNAVSIRVD